MSNGLSYRVASCVLAVLSGWALPAQSTNPETRNAKQAAASVDLSGTWTGDGPWQTIVILGNRGSFLIADKPAPGTIEFSQTGRRSYSGYWKTSDLQGGTLTLRPSEDGMILEGVILTDRFALENAGQSLSLQWNRALPAEGQVRIDPQETVKPAAAEKYEIEVFFDRIAFEKRLYGAVRLVDFDDIETLAGDPVQFSADRYQPSHGILIKGTGGQYADQAFALPQDDFIPVSPPNMYAPGPKNNQDPAIPEGGHDTEVTFWVRDKPAAVAGFGAHFIDADFSGIGPCSLVAFDAEGRQLAVERGFATPHGMNVFVGMVAVNENGAPMPVISRIQVTNGNEWPTTNIGEDVTLDDFVFGLPVVR